MKLFIYRILNGKFKRKFQQILLLYWLSDLFLFKTQKWRIPFEFKTPFGFLMAFSLQYGSIYCIFHISVCISCFLIGSCWMFETFAKEIKREWNSMKKLGKSKKNQVEFKNRIHRYIEFHSTAKQLSLIFEFILQALSAFLVFSFVLSFMCIDCSWISRIFTNWS